MRKIISLIVIFIFVLIMSGCKEENPETWSDWEKSKYCNSYLYDEYDDEPICIEYLEYLESQTTYTQEEVDSLLRQQNMEIMSTLLEYYIQSYDGKLYTNCRIEDSIKVCDEVILDLEARIEKLENETN